MIDLLNQIHKWFIDRLEKGITFTESIMTSKKSYETML